MPQELIATYGKLHTVFRRLQGGKSYKMISVPSKSRYTDAANNFIKKTKRISDATKRSKLVFK